MNGSEEHSGRETRLLVLVILVALAVLLVLARFRFPAPELTAVVAGPGPLDRLAARSTYDDLGDTIADLVRKVEPAIVTVRMEAVPPSGRSPTRSSRPADAPPVGADSWPALAVRVRPELALLYVPAGMRVTSDSAVVGADPERSIVLIRVPPQDPPGASLSASETFTGFRYVAVVEAAVGGATARPLFVGRVAPITLFSWSPPPLIMGGDPDVAAGSTIFALDGRLIGLAVARGAATVIVPVAALDAAARDLAGHDGGR